MTKSEIFKKLRIDAKGYSNEDKIIIYLSGSKNMKKEVQKMVEKYIEDLEFDIELGIVKNIEQERKAAEIMLASVNQMETY